MIPGLGRTPGKGNGNPLPYSCLENPMTEEPSRLHSMGSQSDKTLSLFTLSPINLKKTSRINSLATEHPETLYYRLIRCHSGGGASRQTELKPAPLNISFDKFPALTLTRGWCQCQQGSLEVLRERHGLYHYGNSSGLVSSFQTLAGCWHPGRSTLACSKRC